MGYLLLASIVPRVHSRTTTRIPGTTTGVALLSIASKNATIRTSPLKARGMGLGYNTLRFQLDGGECLLVLVASTGSMALLEVGGILNGEVSGCSRGFYQQTSQ